MSRSHGYVRAGTARPDLSKFWRKGTQHLCGLAAALAPKKRRPSGVWAGTMALWH